MYTQKQPGLLPSLLCFFVLSCLQVLWVPHLKAFSQTILAFADNLGTIQSELGVYKGNTGWLKLLTLQQTLHNKESILQNEMEKENAFSFNEKIMNLLNAAYYKWSELRFSFYLQ